MKFIDLNAQYANLQTDIDARVKRVLTSGQFIKGPEVAELENALAKFVGVEHCIGVANGTDALLIALMALGVKAGDEVIVPDFTFIAPAEVIKLLGAKPVFVDIEPTTFNLNSELLKTAITAKTKAIIAVDLYGQCPDYDDINAIAAEHNLPVIEDAAQSLGATYKGRQACGLTTIGCTSFFPSKPLGCYGDGGACFTNDAELAKVVRCIADHGSEARYNHTRVGVNSRLDTLQAAILLAKLAVFPEEINRRQQIAARYAELLPAEVIAPTVAANSTSVFAQYTIRCAKRQQLQEFLQAQGVPTAIHYPSALHQQDVFQDLGEINCPESVKAAAEVISLPFHPYLAETEQEFVANAIKQGLEKK